MNETIKKNRIYESDTFAEAAYKIYNFFEVNQSCTVRGFVVDEEKEEVTPKGKKILEMLEYHDTQDNIDTKGRRKRKKLPNSIGGYVASKIFRYEERILDKKIIYLIWRVQ